MPDPEERLNPLPVGPMGAVRPGPVESAPTRMNEWLWAAVAAVAPFAASLILRAAISGPPGLIDPPTLAFSLFGLSLAAFVRITGHGRGRNVLALIYMCALLQAGLALYFSGTFDTTRPDFGGLDRHRAAIDRQLSDGQSPLSHADLRSLRDQLAVLHSDDHSPSPSAYIVLSVTGVVSLFVLIRQWSPLAPDGPIA